MNIVKMLIFIIILMSSSVNANEISVESSIQNELGFFLCLEDGISIKYTAVNKKSVKKISKYLSILPAEMKKGIEEIVLIPEKNENVAGITKNEVIYLYDYEQYDVSTQKYIIWHEVGHIWGNYLMQMKLLDYDYTEYSEAVKKDNNYITEYSKNYILNKEKYSEDFADAVVEYLLNKDKFNKKHENRAKYIENLIKSQKKEEIKEVIEYLKDNYKFFEYVVDMVFRLEKMKG